MKNFKFLFLVFCVTIFTIPSIAATSATKKPQNITGKYKSDGPIEITSDSLEILQKKNKAIFTGHVIAVQGDIRIRSETMIVLYKNTGESSNKNTKNEKSMTGAMPEQNSIEKIIVRKNVFLTTPEETASGSHGIYDVVNHKIFLNDNVILTRDKNILKGDRLVYDFITGKSELNSPNSRKPSDKNQPKQRVKALFIPSKNKEKALPSKE